MSKSDDCIFCNTYTVGLQAQGVLHNDLDFLDFMLAYAGKEHAEKRNFPVVFLLRTKFLCGIANCKKFVGSANYTVWLDCSALLGLKKESDLF